MYYSTNAQLVSCKYNSQIHLINGVACFSQHLHTALSVCSRSHVFSNYAKNRQWWWLNQTTWNFCQRSHRQKPCLKERKICGLVVFEISYKQGLTSNVYSVKLDLEMTFMYPLVFRRGKSCKIKELNHTNLSDISSELVDVYVYMCTFQLWSIA